MANVTKAEFYSALVLVWLYIMISLGNSLRRGPRDWPDVLIWLVALAQVLLYSWQAVRTRRSDAAKPRS
jgi:hypothetical protein